MPWKIQQTTDGGYIVGGDSRSGISGDKTENNIGIYDCWVVKLNEAGSIEWQNTIGGSSLEFFNSIQQTDDGGYIVGITSKSGVTGDKTETRIGYYDYWIVKLDNAGGLEWQNTIGGNFDDVLSCVQQIANGGYILGGSSFSGISGDKTEDQIGVGDLCDFWIIALDSSGTIEWQNTIGGDNSDGLSSLHQTSDGGYILGGNSNSNISGDKTEDANLDSNDYWIIKLYPETNPCSAAPTGLYTDFLSSSTAKLHWSADADAIKYKVQYRKSTVASWTNTNATSNVKNLFSLEANTTYKFRIKSNCGAGILSDWSTVATFTTLPLREGELMINELPVVNLYPNPSSGTFTLEFAENFTNDFLFISIKNLLGEEVYSEQIVPSSTEYQIQLDKNIANGVYVVEVKTTNKIFSQQIIISK